MLTHVGRVLLRSGFVLLTSASLFSPAEAQTSQLGSWSSVYDWSCQLDPNNCAAGSEYIEISAAALIPVGPYAGHVLNWRRSRISPTSCTAGTTTETWFFNPTNPSQLLKNQQDLASDIFCAGLSWDLNGRLTVAGGFPAGGPTAPSETYRFDPRLLGVTIYPLSPPAVPCPTPIIKNAPWSVPFLLSIPRYYPTVISLDRRGFGSNCWAQPTAGGSQIVLGGPPTVTNVGNELWQLLDPAITPSTTVNPLQQTLDAPVGTGSQTVTGATETYQISPTHPPGDVRFDSFPRALQLGDDVLGGVLLQGQIFTAFDVDTAAPSSPPNPQGSSWVIKPPPANAATHGCWELAGGPNSGPPQTPGGPPERFYAPSVVLHMLSAKNRVFAFAGAIPADPLSGTPATAFASVQEFTFSGNQPQAGTWANRTPLLRPRVQHNAVVLPTGTVFLVGGRDSAISGSASWVLTPELYEPGASPTFPGLTHALAPTTTPRLYHAVALLLLDGRVLVMGGHQRPGNPDSEHTGEVYSPHYLFNGTRPVIDAAPGRIDFAPTAGTFTIDATLYHDHVEKIVLLRPGAVTHHQDYDQRYIELDFTSPGPYTPSTSVTITVNRPHESLGPPGYYSLWVVESKVATPTGYSDLIPSTGRIISVR